MGLSSDLITQFVKATKNEKPTATETTVYAKVVDANHVRLDGADEHTVTPVTSTVKMEPGERVVVQIKNHSATVIGNVSTQSARSDDMDNASTKLDGAVDQISQFEIIISDYATVSQLVTEQARIDTLIADTATIRDRLSASEADISELETDNVAIKDKLTAHAAIINSLTAGSIDTEFLAANYATIAALDATKADIYNLSSTHASFTETTTKRLDAVDAIIVDLETNKLSATEADVKYANIDFANVGEAAVEHIYALSGLIENVVISNGNITGVLAGVTVKGDLIEGGTVVADKLVIKGDDGLYYKLNTDGITFEGEQTEYNSLNGSVILAKSITATKISVDDLVAFDATIGGFKIGSESLYSGVKESIDNSTSGIFLGSDGQVAFGNSESYLKFYAIYSCYSVTRDSNTGVYTRTDTELDNPVGTVVEGTFTSDGYRVYLSEDGTSYFCRVAEDYKLAISADSILFGTDSKYSMDDVKQLTDHVKIGSHVDVETGEQLPCVELSETDSSFKMRLTNKSATFADGVTDSTAIDSDGIETENLRVKNDIRHYDYVWRRRANGNLGLMWMEVTE